MSNRAQPKSSRIALLHLMHWPSLRPNARARAQSCFTASPSVSLSARSAPAERYSESSSEHERGACTRGADRRRVLRRFRAFGM